jgi:hypothetical protein
MRNDDEIETILSSPATSTWLKNALASALGRDPVDAVNDAELLATVLRNRHDAISSAALAVVVIKQAKN